MTPQMIRIADLTISMADHKANRTCAELYVERLGVPGEVEMIVTLARHIGMYPVTIDCESILRHIDEDGNVVDGFFDGRHCDTEEWWRAWMEETLPVMIVDVTDDPRTQEAQRRLDRWIDRESDTMLVTLVNDASDDASRGHFVIRRPGAGNVSDEIAHLRRLSDVGTRGPWKAYSYLPGAHEICMEDNYATGGVGQTHSSADAELIVAAVNHVRKVVRS